MNNMSDALYNVYIFKKTTKELWDIFDHKYKSKDAGTKKFVLAGSLITKWWIPRL